jgi:hypothetical protein
MVLGDVEETIIVVDVNEETGQELIRVSGCAGSSGRGCEMANEEV